MKRLFDEQKTDAGLREAAELLRHVPAIDEDQFRQRRVRARLPSSAPRRSTWPARAALVGVLAVAGVAAGHDRVRARWLGTGSSATAPRATATATARRDAPVPTSPVTRAASAGSSHPPIASQLVAPVPASTRPREPQRARLAPASPSTPPRDAGTELMVEAMQARRTGDLATAARLLADYRQRFPRGALAEEALALSVETAMLRGSVVTPELARAYLARFPNGRYRSWVERTLQAPR